MIGAVYDFIPPELVQLLKDTISSTEFPWYWRPSSKYGEEERGQKDYQFVHNIYWEGEKKSNLFEPVEEIIRCFVDRTGIEIKSIFRIKVNLTTPSTLSATELDAAIHQDIVGADGKFISIVYYVDNADGDTLVYADGKIVLTNPPIKGSAVYFASEIWHRHTPPTQHKRRLVINFVLELL